MLIPFYTGWALLFLAFAAAAAETLARGLPIETQSLLSAKQLWHSLWPSHYVVTRSHIEQALPWLWDPLLLALLTPPAWFLFGFPGTMLAWFCRPNRHMTEEERRDLEKMRQTLFLFDELATDAERQLREDGDDPGNDDMVPSHGGHDALDVAERLPQQVDEEFLRQYELNLKPDVGPIILLGEEPADEPPPSNDNRGGT